MQKFALAWLKLQKGLPRNGNVYVIVDNIKLWTICSHNKM